MNRRKRASDPLSDPALPPSTRRISARCHGQALLESVPFFVILFTFVTALLAVSQWFLIRQKLLIAARHGAMLYSSGRLMPSEVHRRLRAYLVRGPVALDSQRLHLYVGRWTGRQSRLFQLDQVRVRYQPHPWMRRFFEQTLEEKCVIKHAPRYGPLVPPVFGPPVRW